MSGDQQPPENVNQSTIEPVTSAILSEWLRALSLDERKRKIERLVRATGKEERTIDNWRRQQEPPAKYHAAIRSVMEGKDTVRVDFAPEVFAIVREAAEKRGYKSVEEYIEAIAKVFTITLLLALVAWQAFAPDDHQLVRKFGRGRRRDDIAAVEEIDTDGGEG